MTPPGHEASGRAYDVVVVGAGVMGMVFAKVLAELAYRDRRSLSILILEAGTGHEPSEAAHQAYLDTYFGALIKTPNAPYPISANAPSPEDLAFLKPPSERYFVQRGPLPFGSNNTRLLGGTTHHWMGIALRMMRADFECETRYQQGTNWPFGYDTLRPYYERAEWEIGVAADRAAQLQIHGVSAHDFGAYDFPMERIPTSYLDEVLATNIGADYKFEIDHHDYPVRLVAIPQARNSIPTTAAQDPRDYLDASRRNPEYLPYGAPEAPLTGPGQRCEGNASCIPICPSRAKYTALKTLQQLRDLAKLPGITVELITKAVASDIEVDADGEVRRVNYLRYDEPSLPYATAGYAVGRRFILAASGIENAKLLLASRGDPRFADGLANSSGCVGRHLMDHPFVLTWGLMPEGKPVGAFRGPGVTSDLPMRDGDFRRNSAAFRTDVGNWGWALADDAPSQDVERLINPQALSAAYAGRPQIDLLPGAPLYGASLRASLKSRIARQVTLGFLIEQLPDPKNRITIDDDERDQLGLHRPVIEYDISDYSRAGMSTAVRLARDVFRRIGATDYTDLATALGTPVTFRGETFKYIGAGHIMGTHRMGGSSRDSVVNEFQQSWDHRNLYVVGCGSMPTAGTSNPTLTSVALVIRSAEHLFKALELPGR
jgi:choline dehydrogenase-like flavoprotein